MLGRNISLRSGEEYLRTRICAQRCDMSICQREMPDERSEAALGVIVRDEGQGCRNRRVAEARGDPSERIRLDQIGNSGMDHRLPVVMNGQRYGRGNPISESSADGWDLPALHREFASEIGRAWCRERGCKSV